MLLTCLVSLSLAAKPNVAVAGLSFVNVSTQESDAYVDAFAVHLAKSAEVEVFTRSQLAQMLDTERQKKLLGCSDDAVGSCLAELSGAVGAEYLVTGSLGKLGATFTVSLKLVSSRTSKAPTTFSSRAQTEEALLDELNKAAVAFAQFLRAEQGLPPLVVSERASGPRLGVKFWVPLGVAVGLGALSGVSFGLSSGSANQLKTDNFQTQAAILQVRSEGQLWQGLAVGSLIGAGVAAVTAVVLLFVPQSGEAVAFVPSFAGGAFTW